MLKNILLILVLGMFIGCSTEQQTTTSSQPGHNATALSNQVNAFETQSFDLVFFLDPNGGPCKRQNAILMSMSGEFSGKVDIKYVKTTIPADRNLFYQYGIRALPTLLLADSSGKEIQRMTPGIKNPDEIRALIQSIHRS